MAQKTGYRPTPTNPTTPAAAPQATSSAIEDLDDFMAEVDDLLEENVLEVLQSYRQLGGE